MNLVDNFIYMIPVSLTSTIAGVFPYWEYKQQDAKLYGFDLKYERKLFKDFFIGSEFSIVKGYEKSNNKIAIGLPLLHRNEVIRIHDASNNRSQGNF